MADGVKPVHSQNDSNVVLITCPPREVPEDPQADSGSDSGSRRPLQNNPNGVFGEVVHDYKMPPTSMDDTAGASQLQQPNTSLHPPSRSRSSRHTSSMLTPDLESSYPCSPTVYSHASTPRHFSDLNLPGKSGKEQLSEKQQDRKERIEDIPLPPDGGYGWVVVVSIFLMICVLWGNASCYGIFLSYYRKTQYFPDARPLDFAWIPGIVVSSTMFGAPVANWLGTKFHFKAPMFIGLAIFVAAQILAGFSKRIWHLYLTQGLLFGMGLGLVFIPTFPLVSQWFHRRRALALGLVSAGNGGGALALSFITHSTIDKFGLRWAMIINGIISFAVLLPCILLLRTRGATRYATLQTRFWKHKGYIWVLLWGNFASVGYLICLLTISTYATSGLGLSQGKGALVLAVLAAGQIIGRPTSGLILDRFGRLTMTAILTFTAGLTCLLVWMFSRQLSVLIVFAFLQGCIGGIFWSACGPVTAEVVGLLDMGSAMVILWVSVAPVSLFAETIAISLVDYSTHQLNRTGADAFRISIGIAGGSFVLSSLFLLGAKRYVQGNWNMLQKS